MQLETSHAELAVHTIRELDARIRLRSMTLPCGPNQSFRSIVTIPARDEAKRIRSCLHALAISIRACDESVLVVVVVNNTRDGTAQLACKFAEEFSLHAVVVSLDLPPAGGVGLARAAGFHLAASWWPGAQYYFTTDADSRVDPGWILRSRYWLEVSDAVCGRVLPDPEERASLPERIDQPGGLEHHYLQLMLETEALLEPSAVNSWPHHGRASGASLAFRSAPYAQVGGFAHIVSNEDNALCQRFKAHGYRVKYADDVEVTTSCRLTGRAPDGMADALARRVSDLDSHADTMLEPASTYLLRIRARIQCLKLLDEGSSLESLARFLGSDSAIFERSNVGSMGPMLEWSLLEAQSPRLRRRRLRPSELSTEIALLERELIHIKRSSRNFRVTHLSPLIPVLVGRSHNRSEIE